MYCIHSYLCLVYKKGTIPSPPQNQCWPSSEYCLVHRECMKGTCFKKNRDALTVWNYDYCSHVPLRLTPPPLACLNPLPPRTQSLRNSPFPTNPYIPRALGTQKPSIKLPDVKRINQVTHKILHLLLEQNKPSFVESITLPMPVLCNRVATRYTRLFQLKRVRFKNQKISSSATLATFQVLSKPTELVATTLSSKNV